MKLAEWLKYKLDFVRLLRYAIGSLRYNGFYINIHIKEALIFKHFKKYYDEYLKGKVIDYPFGEMGFNKSDGSVKYMNITKIRLGGIKSCTSLGRHKSKKSIKITLWFPEVKYA